MVLESIVEMSDWMPLDTGLEDGQRICAVGDVHGCSRQFLRLLDDLESRNAEYDRNILVLMGDYIDRGPDSLGAVDAAISAAHRSFDSFYPLMGNHEQLMRIALRAGPGDSQRLWLENGGDSVLQELGIPYGISEAEPDVFSTEIGEAWGAERKSFLDSIFHHRTFGNLLFVHAGINQEITLEEHLSQPWDLLVEKHWVWIRYPFLYKPTDLDPITVVHGHTPAFILNYQAPRTDLVTMHGPRDGKMNLDAGCFESGRLAAGEFVKDSCRVVTRYEEKKKEQ